MLVPSQARACVPVCVCVLLCVRVSLVRCVPPTVRHMAPPCECAVVSAMACPPSVYSVLGVECFPVYIQPQLCMCVDVRANQCGLACKERVHAPVCPLDGGVPHQFSRLRADSPHDFLMPACSGVARQRGAPGMHEGIEEGSCSASVASPHRASSCRPFSGSCRRAAVDRWSHEAQGAL